MTGVEEKLSSLNPVPCGTRRTSGFGFSRFSGRLFVAAVALICLFSPRVQIWTGIAFVLVAYIFVDFSQNSSNGIQLVDITLLIAGMQWFILAHFVYLSQDSFNARRMMQVSEGKYMFNTLLAYVGYWMGMKLFAPKLILWERETRTSEMFWNIAIKIGVILFVANFIFPSFITNMGIWIITGYLLKNICRTSSPKGYIWALVVVDVYMLVRSVISSMFHQLLLLLLMQFLFITVIRKISGKKVCLLILAGMMLINVIQVSKSQYRASMDQYGVTGRVGVFHQLFWDNIQNMFSSDGYEEYPLARYNQGWLISYVYIHEDGEFHAEKLPKFVESLTAIVLPRFLMPNKRLAGGRDNINDFTDLVLDEETSMNISTVGEGYAYFGRYGNFFFHFIIGSIFAGVLQLLMHWEKLYGVGVFCIPAIFSLAIRAESDCMTGYNALLKMLLLFAVILWYCNVRMRRRGNPERDHGHFANGSGGSAKGAEDIQV